MAAGRRRKVGAVRQVGGRISPEHRNGRLIQVVASRLPCPVCGSGKIRVTTSGQECEPCRQTGDKRRKHRTELRRFAAGRALPWLIGRRSQEADLMLARYTAWQALGPDPLPDGRKTLERLQARLDAVHVLDAELKRRYAAGSPLTQPLGVTDRQAAASRRRLFAALAAGRRTVTTLMQQDDRLGEQQALLDATHAFAVFAAQYGHRTAAAAFRQTGVLAGLSWQAATAHLPVLAQVAAAVTLLPAETRDRLDEITALDANLEAEHALRRAARNKVWP
ncbi:hypothetical protein [Streptomyces sp. B21-083]|uniref:hypothetical protein n=1 Tax=Streptomyces sp. B21-083 TaxID=3039410 RepID=UPI002FEF2BF9